jgi:hypothetical protein
VACKSAGPATAAAAAEALTVDTLGRRIDRQAKSSLFSNHDRAAVVTTAVLQLVLSSSAPTEVRDGIEALLRNEFADVERQAIADRCLGPHA